jgi:hypothetical protein
MEDPAGRTGEVLQANCTSSASFLATRRPGQFVDVVVGKYVTAGEILQQYFCLHFDDALRECSNFRDAL